MRDSSKLIQRALRAGVVAEEKNDSTAIPPPLQIADRVGAGLNNGRHGGCNSLCNHDLNQCLAIPTTNVHL